LNKTPSNSLRIGHMGQIAPHKGVHVLFEAAAQMPQAALEVKAYGDAVRFPGYTKRLRDMAGQDDRLKLMGTYGRTRVSQVLQELDVVVVPSVWYENSPNTILEAFAHRTPVIVSDLGGMAELVQDGVNGLLFNPGDAASLAAGLRQLLDKPDLLDRLRAGIKPIKTVAQEMEELQETYRYVTGSGDSQSQGERQK